MIAISDRIPSRIIHVAQSVELLEPQHKINFCCTYIPPNSNDSYIHEIVSCLTSLPKSIQTIVAGDFNMPDIDWNQLTCTSLSRSLLCDAMFDLNLLQLVSSPTHTHGNIIDIVATNQPDEILNLTIHNYYQCSSSDHYLISFDINFPVITRNSNHKFSHEYIFSQELTMTP